MSDQVELSPVKTSSFLDDYSRKSAHKPSGPSGRSLFQFLSMKQLQVFLLPPGWDASPSQGYPPALNLAVPIYTPGWREAM